MGKIEGNAEKLRTCPGKQKCGKDLRGSLAHGDQISHCLRFFNRKLEPSKEEVDALMKLLRNYMKTCLKTAAKNDMKVRVIGDLSGLDEDIRSRILELQEATKGNGGLNFQIAINYGSRDEILRAVRKIAEDCREGKVEPEKIDEAVFEQYLDTHEIPDPDLLIRTSGEQRLSNYLLWQLAYTEFYFTDVLWPDFTKEELEKAVLKYNERDRRYGGVKGE